MGSKIAEYGYEIQVGDIIRVITRGFGEKNHKVHRVTKKYAFVKYNDVVERKFPRIFDNRFESFPRHLWNTNQYEIVKAKP